jgi:WD repeat-containing protein 48
MQKLPITMSLATLRAHVWKGGADVMLYYKSNGRKVIKIQDPAEPEVDIPAETTPSTSTSTTAAPIAV